MDRVRKLLGMDDDQPSGGEKSQQSGAPFRARKEEEAAEDDDVFDNRLFGNVASQLFINPTELQKQIEAQFQDIIRQMEDVEGEFPDAAAGGDDSMFSSPVTAATPEGMMRDEEIKGDDFKRLISATPFISSSPSLQRKEGEKPRKQLTDDEKVMDRIHGTVPEVPNTAGMVAKRSAIGPNFPPGHPRVDIQILQPPNGGRGMTWSMSSMTTVRRSDGSSETKKITYDKNGNQLTTIITTDKNGKKTETKTVGGSQGNAVVDVPLQEEEKKETWSSEIAPIKSLLNIGRHFFVTSSGYTLPKNLW